MNIFVIDESPWLSAIHQHDRHAVKMTIESLQLLSTACHLVPYLMNLVEPHHVGTLYKPISNPNHQCAIWTRQSPANFAWVTIHAAGLMHEYQSRFRKVHSAYHLLRAMQTVVCKLAKVDRFWTRNDSRDLVIDPAILALAAQHDPFVYCGFPQYFNGNIVESYRAFYLGEKLFTRANQANRWSIPESRCLPSWLAPHANRFDRWAIPERAVAKPHVPTGFGIPSFLRNATK